MRTAALYANELLSLEWLWNDHCSRQRPVWDHSWGNEHERYAGSLRRMTSYSSKGPTAIDHIVKPDLVAPGNRVVSLQTGGYLQKNYPGNRPAVSYYQTGTSGSVSGKYFIFGEAMVSGAAVCL